MLQVLKYTISTAFSNIVFDVFSSGVPDDFLEIGRGGGGTSWTFPGYSLDILRQWFKESVIVKIPPPFQASCPIHTVGVEGVCCEPVFTPNTFYPNKKSKRKEKRIKKKNIVRPLFKSAAFFISKFITLQVIHVPLSL